MCTMRQLGKDARNLLDTKLHSADAGDTLTTSQLLCWLVHVAGMLICQKQIHKPCHTSGLGVLAFKFPPPPSKYHTNGGSTLKPLSTPNGFRTPKGRHVGPQNRAKGQQERQ
jgi:hypothetical protein